jgi:iron complex outermembrane receptor protein
VRHSSSRSGLVRAVLDTATALTLAGAAIASAQAQDFRLASTNDLKQLSLEDLLNVEVTSVSRHPQRLRSTASAIQVISGEDIRRSGATSLPEALKLADNLDVVQKNSHDWGITARGFNTQLANKLLVLIDGRTVYTPLFSGVFWDVQNVMLADVDRIEVISGPGGTQWGANAVNGVINVITRSARDTQGSYVEASAGNQLHDLVAARYGGSTSPQTYYRVYAQTFDRGAESLGDGSDAHDGWNQTRVGFRIDSQRSASESVMLQGSYYEGHEDVVTGDTARVSGSSVLGRWSRTLAPGSQMNLQAYFSRTHLEDPFPPFVLGGAPLAPAGFLVDDLDTFDIDFQYRFAWGERQHVQWGAGYRYTRDRVDNAPSVAFLPERLDQRLYSAFVQDEIAFGPTLTLTVGSKFEHNDYTGGEVEPGARLLWDVDPGHSLWLALSRAVRTPSRIDRDLVEPAPGSPLTVLVGSEQFQSETLVAAELGYRAQFNDRVTTSVSAYRNAYRDLRSTGLTPVSGLPLVFENNVEGYTYGLELAIDVQATESWRLHFGYDPIREHLRVKPGAFDFNAALNEVADPHDRVSIRSALDLPGGLEFDANARWTSPRAINSGAVIETIPSYWDLELRLGWHPSEHLELSLAGQNLLYARRALYGFPGPDQVQIERAVYGKVAWRF